MILKFKGITPDHKEKSFKDLQTKADFLAHAEKLGEEITERREHPHYLTFVNSLIEQMIGPSIFVSIFV